MEVTMKIVKSLEGSSLLIKGVTKVNENETKEKRRGFLGMLLGTLRTNLLERKSFLSKERNYPSKQQGFPNW